MSTPIAIRLPWERPPLTGNRVRGNPHARANEVKRAKIQAQSAVRAAANLPGQSETKPRPIVGADVTLHFRPKNRHRRDADGLAPTLKVCLDALVAEGVLPDDCWVNVPRIAIEIHPPKKGQPAAMWLELTNITDYDEGAEPA